MAVRVDRRSPCSLRQRFGTKLARRLRAASEPVSCRVIVAAVQTVVSSGLKVPAMRRVRKTINVRKLLMRSALPITKKPLSTKNMGRTLAISGA